MISVIHVTNEGRPMDNAFWNGTLIAYGDGNRRLDPLAAALDVAAHEMTHGVIERTVNLEYRFQSGALNESFADVFGAMVDRDDWLLGEDVVKRSFFPSGALRNMEDPHNGGDSGDFFWQPAHMDEFVELDITRDNGGVHVNSGIPNRVCFLIATAIGRDKTEQLYYRILEARYLNTRSNFIDMRLAARRAAADLFGDPSPELDAVKAAFDQVGIVGDEGMEAPADILPVSGEQWIAVVNAEPSDHSLYLVRPEVRSNDDIKQLTTTQVYTGTGKPISVVDDGSVILFVDARHFIRAINSDGTGEEVISTRGIWRSIALSPDGRRLAATSRLDNTIVIFDLANLSASKAVRLYNPTTQEGVEANVARFADVLDWDLDSRFVVYDAFNSVSQAGGVPISFWNVNILDVDNEIILPLFPAQPRDITIGNPSFSQASNNFIVFDLIDSTQNTSDIWAVNLFTGDANLIESNGFSIGYPKFSPDDGHVVFQRLEENVPTLRQIPLAPDKIHRAGPSENYLIESQRPAWFAMGSRASQPTGVELEDQDSSALPTSYRLHQNFPNPFNSKTIIRYALPHDGSVSLAIYDLQGRRVAVLESGFKRAGEYGVHWNGLDSTGRSVASGVYLYRLKATAPDVIQTRMSQKMTLLK